MLSNNTYLLLYSLATKICLKDKILFILLLILDSNYYAKYPIIHDFQMKFQEWSDQNLAAILILICRNQVLKMFTLL